MELITDSYDSAFSKIVPKDASLECVGAGFRFLESPVWRGDHLLFVDIPKDRMVIWRMGREGPSVTTYRHPCGHTNGLTLDMGGRLIACEPGMRRVTVTELDGRYSVLAESYEGKRFSGPSDVVARSDGSIYFTDNLAAMSGNDARPAYAFVGHELSFQGVYRIAPGGELQLLADDFEMPNGLAFSPDESVLYVIDTPRRHVRAFDVASDGSIGSGRVFVELQIKSEDENNYRPDGMKVDRDGNVYVGGPGGIWVVNAEGACLGRIMTPKMPANVGWGDSDWKTLYICMVDCLYRLRLNVPGVPVGPGLVG